MSENRVNAYEREQRAKAHKHLFAILYTNNVHHMLRFICSTKISKSFKFYFFTKVGLRILRQPIRRLQLQRLNRFYIYKPHSSINILPQYITGMNMECFLHKIVLKWFPLFPPFLFLLSFFFIIFFVVFSFLVFSHYFLSFFFFSCSFFCFFFACFFLVSIVLFLSWSLQ